MNVQIFRIGATKRVERQLLHKCHVQKVPFEEKIVKMAALLLEPTNHAFWKNLECFRTFWNTLEKFGILLGKIWFHLNQLLITRHV